MKRRPAPPRPPQTAANTPAEHLARLAIQTLDKQREYFDRGRVHQVLLESKQLERRLRAAAEAILHPPQTQTTIFGEE